MNVIIHGQRFVIHASGFGRHTVDAEAAEELVVRLLHAHTATALSALDAGALLGIGSRAAAEVTRGWHRSSGVFGGDAAGVEIARQ